MNIWASFISELGRAEEARAQLARLDRLCAYGPGVGKGTQGKGLSEANGWPLISTGEMLRESVSQGSSLGRVAQALMDQGLLVSDDVMIGLVEQRTNEADAKNGFILDGFPRTVPQADALEGILRERGQVLNAVLSLSASADRSSVACCRAAARMTWKRRCASASRCTTSRPHRSSSIIAGSAGCSRWMVSGRWTRCTRGSVGPAGAASA